MRRPAAVILLCLLAILLLSACTATRYVRVPCLTEQEYQKRKDAEPPLVGKDLTGDAQKDVRIIGGSAKELRAWGVGNLDILGGCKG